LKEVRFIPSLRKKVVNSPFSTVGNGEDIEERGGGVRKKEVEETNGKTAPNKCPAVHTVAEKGEEAPRPL